MPSIASLRAALSAFASRALVAAAINGPVAWAASWHARVWAALLMEELEAKPLYFADLLPWARATTNVTLEVYRSDEFCPSNPLLDRRDQGPDQQPSIRGSV